jgi:hypothetical protein
MKKRKITERIKTLQYGWLGPFGSNNGTINYCQFMSVMAHALQQKGCNIDETYLDFGVDGRSMERVNVTLCVDRKETDEEFEKRRCAKEKEELKEKQYRRKQYKKLKKEFEGEKPENAPGV